MVDVPMRDVLMDWSTSDKPSPMGHKGESSDLPPEPQYDDLGK